MSLLARQRVGLLQADAASGQQALRAAAMVLLSFCGACLTGLLAQLRIPLPFTPVPITGQVFAVLICGATFSSTCCKRLDKPKGRPAPGRAGFARFRANCVSMGCFESSKEEHHA